MKLSTKFLGTAPLPREGQMCLLKQMFKRGFLTFKNITHNLFFSFQKFIVSREELCQKTHRFWWNVLVVGEILLFLRSFFDPQAPVVIMCFPTYIRSVLCACQGGEDTWVINSSYPLSSLDLSTFFFLSFLVLFTVTFRPTLVNPTRDFPLLNFP